MARFMIQVFQLLKSLNLQRVLPNLLAKSDKSTCLIIVRLLDILYLVLMKSHSKQKRAHCIRCKRKLKTDNMILRKSTEADLFPFSYWVCVPCDQEAKEKIAALEAAEQEKEGGSNV